MIYLDTSVVVAYYCPEPLSGKAERVVRAQVRPAVSELTELEFLSAVSRKVRQRQMRHRDAVRVAAQFLAHLEGLLYTRVALDRRHYRLAGDWMGRFTTPLRTLDALHLAVASSEGMRLATADGTLARSGEALGVETLWLRSRRA